KQQILARADQLAERALRLWPGPLDATSDYGDARDWSLLRRACASLPTGTWTTYGDLAGSHRAGHRPERTEYAITRRSLLEQPGVHALAFGSLAAGALLILAFIWQQRRARLRRRAQQ